MSDLPPNALTLCIADWHVTLRLDGCDAATRARIAERYAAFVVATQPTALSIHVRVEPGPAYIPFDLAPTWQIRTAARDGRIEFESHLEKGWIVDPATSAMVDRAAGTCPERSRREGALVLRPRGDPENFLRVLYAWLCLDHDALLLHACGVIREGRGYVFFGPSGSGKTTTARLSQEHIVLSDDLVILKKVAGKYRVFGVPFRGDLPAAPRTNASADLHGIFALVKDTQHSIAPLAVSEAVARLSACVPFVMAQPASVRRVIEICVDLAARVPVRALHFRRDAGFWKLIDQAGG